MKIQITDYPWKDAHIISPFQEVDFELINLQTQEVVTFKYYRNYNNYEIDVTFPGYMSRIMSVRT